MCQKASHRTLAVSSPCLRACTVVSVGCSAVWKTGAPALSARTIFSRNCASRVGHWASTRQTRLRRAGPATGTGTRLSTLVRRLWPLGVDCRMLTSWLQMSQKKTRLPETVWKFWCFTDTRNLSLLTFCWDLCVGPVPLRYCCFYTTRWCKPSFRDGVLSLQHGTALMATIGQPTILISTASEIFVLLHRPVVSTSKVLGPVEVTQRILSLQGSNCYIVKTWLLCCLLYLLVLCILICSTVIQHDKIVFIIQYCYSFFIIIKLSTLISVSVS